MTIIETTRINRRITILSLIVAIGVVLHRLEILIPLPSPWVKLGLANVMTLVTLIFFGLRDAITVTLLRVMLGSIIGGTFLSPTFFLSLSGGVAAVFAMSWVYCQGKSPFSLVGVSVCAAYTHTLTTITCVYFFWVQQEFIFKLLPIFFIFTLIAGVLTGIIGNFIVIKLTERQFVLKKQF
jgi:heptaprenyl diphosphate synthase